MRTKSIFIALGSAGGLAISVLGACSLGLDASKLDVPPEASSADVTVETALPDAQPVEPGATKCLTDKDCERPCYSGVCGADGKCKIEYCPPRSFPCYQGACTAGVCGQPVTAHKFVAGQFSLGRAGLGCGGVLGSCVAVVYPFAFVGPKTGGVAAYALDNFGTSDAGAAFEPASVPIENVDFNPSRIVASNGRVWFLGDTRTVGPSVEVQVAWIDVAYDSGLAKLTASRGALKLFSPATQLIGAMRGADGGLLLLFNTSQGLRATQLKVDKGAVNPDIALSTIPNFDGVSSSIVASSGDRLLLGRPVSGPPTASYQLEIIRNAGSASASALGEKDLSTAVAPNALYPNLAFASTPKGGVLVQGAVAQLEDGGVVGLDGVKVAWFMDSDFDTTYENRGNAKVLTFPKVPEAGVPVPDPSLVGPLAAIEEDMAIALQLDGDAGSTVRVVTRDPVAQTATADLASEATLPDVPSRFIIYGARSAVTGRSFGYAFSRPLTDADGIKVTVFEVGCSK